MPRSNNKEYCKVFTTVRLQTRCFGSLALMGNIPYSPLLFPVPWLLPIWSGLLPWAYLGHCSGSLNGLKYTIRLNWMETDLKSKSTPPTFFMPMHLASTPHHFNKPYVRPIWMLTWLWFEAGVSSVDPGTTQVINNNCNCFYGPKIKLTDLHL